MAAADRIGGVVGEIPVSLELDGAGVRGSGGNGLQ
jgi:hypothetical protein